MSAFAAPETDVTPQQAADLLADGAQIVDVRESYEHEAGHIAGTRHIDLERLASQADTLDRSRPIVFYCRIGARSAMAASAFRTAGYDSYSLTGGITAWVEAGLPIDPDGGYVADH